jgi:hypothetical protein
MCAFFGDSPVIPASQESDAFLAWETNFFYVQCSLGTMDRGHFGSATNSAMNQHNF